MHKLPQLIAICGAKRAGKDTIASIISDKYGYNHIKIAQKLKTVCKILFNFTDEQLESDCKENIDAYWNISPRQAMQWIGTDVMQYQVQHLLPNIDRKFWIQSVVNQIDINPEVRYIISDLRFKHEVEELKKRNAFIIKVERPSMTNIDNHISEREYLDIQHDLLIKNEDINQLINQIESFFGH